jgi:probable HAF family extracellular repeat protein
MSASSIAAVSTAFLLTVLASASALAAPPMYRITLIPHLPSDPCQVLGLNDAGQATGRCNNLSFIWTSAQGTQAVQDPRFPNAQLHAFAINNKGMLTGTRFDSHTGRNPSFVWDPIQGFTYFGSREKYKDARDINDLGVVVGSRADRDSHDSVWKAYQWSPGTGYQLMTPHADRRTAASAINNNGEVAGFLEKLSVGVTHAVRFEAGGGATWLFPGQHGLSHGSAINQLGHVVGFRQNARNRVRAFVWTPQSGGFDIDDRPLQTDESRAQAINDAGQVVGKTTWVDAAGNTQEGVFYWDASHGFLDLLALLDPNDPLSGQLLEVYPDAGMNINASGAITLNARSTGGQSWAMVLTPVQ